MLDERTVPRPADTIAAASDRESLSQRAYNYISSRLISGTMRPGEKLILRPLAARLGLSPTPVREALLRLVSEQALVLDERGSAIVPLMTAEQFREMCDMRGDLEARAAERAARLIRATDLEALRDACDASVLSYHRDRSEGILTTNARFHRQLCLVGQSPMIQRALEGLWIRLGPTYGLALATHGHTVPPDGTYPAGGHPHERLVAALRSGDTKAAREAALQDVDISSRVISASLRID